MKIQVSKMRKPASVDGRKFYHRLKELENVLGLTPGELARLLDCSISSYYRYRNGTTIPDLDIIQKILRIHKKINPEWLISGFGPVFKDDNQNYPPGANGGEFLSICKLPMYHMKSAKKNTEGKIKSYEWGYPSEYFSLCKNFLDKLLNTDPTGLFMITVGCNSMEPVIKSNSVVIADEKQNEIENDGIYVISFDDIIRLKIIQKLPRNNLQLSTINDQYKPIVLNENAESGMCILGKVIWAGIQL